MIRYENKNYYTCTEIAEALNNHVSECEDFERAFRKAFNKNIDFYFTQQYIQAKLYSVAEKKLINYLSYENRKKQCKAFNLADIAKFSKTVNPKELNRVYTNIKLVIAEGV